jgi:hypothetical protein
MGIDALSALINPRLLVVVAACSVFGSMLKQTPKVEDWLIIWLVTCLAIMLTCLILGLGPISVIQGILCAAVAVYGNQLLKQTTRREP